MDVVLQAGLRVVARQVDLAGGHQEVAVNEVHQPVGQVAGKEGAEVGGAVLAQPPGDVDARILLGGQLDVGVGLVVAQQDVEARLPLLDQVVLEGQRFLLVVDQDVVDVARLGDQGAGLGVRQALVGEVAAHAGAQVLGLAHVDHRASVVLVEVDAGRERATARLSRGDPSDDILLL